LQTNYAAGLQPFQQNYGVASQGQDAYADATGVNGPAGNARATQNFQAGPGYQWQLQQGDNNILANQAATGQLNSGATNLDLQKYGQGLANQSWGQYVQNLQPFLGASNSAAGGIGTLNAGLGNQVNASNMGQGNAAYGAQTSIGNANANADLAGLNASANGLGALGGGISLATNLLGFLSDARAKDDIEPVGELYDGQRIYKYRYKGDPRHQIGLIAQEVEENTPDAVIDMGGLKGVNYDRATSYAAGLGRFVA
jgi:Chaperone of endosialidase